MSARVTAVAKLMEGALFNANTSAEILLNMWEKWVFLASLAAGTCLLRATIGDIYNSTGGTDLVFGLLEECCSIASAEGYQMRDAYLKRTREMLATPGSTLTASMLRDIERNAPIEAEHIIGDLIERGRRHNLSGSGTSLLGIAYTHLKAYEARRSRTMKASPTES
jgi:2-dehydropantoate 2-reductase